MLRLLSMSKSWLLRLHPLIVRREGETLGLLDEPPVPTTANQERWAMHGFVTLSLLPPKYIARSAAIPTALRKYSNIFSI